MSDGQLAELRIQLYGLAESIVDAFVRESSESDETLKLSALPLADREAIEERAAVFHEANAARMARARGMFASNCMIMRVSRESRHVVDDDELNPALVQPAEFERTRERFSTKT